MENRKSPRVPLDLYLNKFIRGRPYMARARDLSVEGIYLTQLIEPSGSESCIGIQFQLPGSDEVIYAEGIAVREGEQGHGILFTSMQQAHRRLIQDYVHRELSACARPADAEPVSGKAN